MSGKSLETLVSRLDELLPVRVVEARREYIQEKVRDKIELLQLAIMLGSGLYGLVFTSQPISGGRYVQRVVPGSAFVLNIKTQGSKYLNRVGGDMKIITVRGLLRRLHRLEDDQDIDFRELPLDIYELCDLFCSRSPKVFDEEFNKETYDSMNKIVGSGLELHERDREVFEGIQENFEELERLRETSVEQNKENLKLFTNVFTKLLQCPQCGSALSLSAEKKALYCKKCGHISMSLSNL